MKLKKRKKRVMIQMIKIGDGIKFERIRRITGYLVGTIDRFNNAKANEVRDRVVHSNCCK